ncbi:MAG TPA: glycosyl hydrolase family 28-related protein [Burkholderiaceae bacterium]|nr:glycosyl hydrolase family 28-related protein [Burkholderiaceae bacterium]
MRDFGALPDDNRDDTDAIQHALDSLKAGETLVFSPGRYLINRSLRVRNPGITITGPNATIHATNPDNQALVIEADNTTVSSLTFTAVTDVRRSAAWHSRIVVADDIGGGNYRTVYNTVIRNNRIVNAGDPGTPTANSASAGGILLMHANGFLVTGNTVVRTLADGIHVTAGSKNGRILNNVVRETGDDMIGVVSYTSSSRPVSPAAVLANWFTRVETYLVRNVLIAGNQLSGPYWGRGISVVGGQSITISSNTIDNMPLAAGVYLSREAAYQTFGVENVVIENNLIRDEQTRSPPYDFRNIFATASRTGHGAVEIQAGVFQGDEEANVAFREAVAVRNVLVRGNVIDRATYTAARAGVNLVQTLTFNDGVLRHVVAGEVHNVGFANNQFNNVMATNTPGREALRVPSVELSTHGVYCTGNNRDGPYYQPSVCKQATEPAVRGAPLNCSPEGMLLQ